MKPQNHESYTTCKNCGHEYNFWNFGPICPACNHNTARRPFAYCLFSNFAYCLFFFFFSLCLLPTAYCQTAASRQPPAAFLITIKTGKHYVIENVPQAPIRPDIILCGNMFGLHVLRKRIFELNFFMLQFSLIPEFRRVGIEISCIYGKADSNRTPVHRFGFKTIRESWAYSMGIDWYMTEAELAEAIPPAYTEFIGKSYLQNLPF